jgi:hypothetical protein
MAPEITEHFFDLDARFHHGFLLRQTLVGLGKLSVRSPGGFIADHPGQPPAFLGAIPKSLRMCLVIIDF